jgi:hypothetical protein
MLASRPNIGSTRGSAVIKRLGLSILVATTLYVTSRIGNVSRRSSSDEDKYVLRSSPIYDVSSTLPVAGFTELPAGWNHIAVYVGDKTSLPGNDPAKLWLSQAHQDEIIVDLIGESGYFVDLAANDAVSLSNTLALERRGWNGLCVEPNPAYWYGLAHRNCTLVGALLGATNGEKVPVQFRGAFGGMAGLINNPMATYLKIPDAPVELRYTAAISTVLQHFKVPETIDYFSLDVEGAEYLIMQHFPFETYQIRVLTVERPSAELRILLGRHGFVFLKMLATFGEELWAHKSMGLTPEHPKIAKLETVSGV